MKGLFLTVLLLLTCMTVCYGQHGDAVRLQTIEVASNLGTYRQVPMSEVVSEVEYVSLETGAKFLIDRVDDVIVTADRIFIASENYCYAFTRDGKFISDVGRQGRGPGEWVGTVSGMSVDQVNRVIYLDVYDTILEYTWDGAFKREIPIPSSGSGTSMARAMDISFLRDNLFLGWISSIVRAGRPYWIIFDDKGTTMKTIDNRMGSVTKNVKWSNSRAMNTPVVSGEAYVKENINDTLYLLDRRDRLVPAYIFEFGRHSLLESRDVSSDIRLTDRHYITIPRIIYPWLQLPIVITSKYVFFSLDFFNANRSGITIPRGEAVNMRIGGNGMVREYHDFKFDNTGILFGLYDLVSRKTELLDRDLVSRKYGLVNDIDGGLSFWPRYYTSSDELVDVWEAYEMKELLTEEYFSAHPARDPAAHARLRALLRNLDEGDNPVIVVAKLKK